MNYKLLLVGPGDIEYLKKITDLIQLKNLSSRIVRAGYTPYPQSPISFQAADLFVLPSSFEGFPKVVVQSLSCGVPALVSGFKAKDDIKGLYYLDNVEPENIAKQIREIVEGPMAKDVDTNFVRANFSWEVKAMQVEEVYKTLRK